MKIIKPSFHFMNEVDGENILKHIELIGRICYKSEDKITDTSKETFIAKLIKAGHESVLEHETITVKIICDRGVSHELVRHRIASYSQESTRYCNYSSDKFGNELTFIKPCFWDEDTEQYSVWLKSMKNAEENYFSLINLGAKPQEARSVLPNSLKTEIAMTLNLRAWRNFFKLRCSKAAHPQMREIAIKMLFEFRQAIPIIFDDIEYYKEEENR